MDFRPNHRAFIYNEKQQNNAMHFIHNFYYSTKSQLLYTPYFCSNWAIDQIIIHRVSVYNLQDCEVFLHYRVQ